MVLFYSNCFCAQQINKVMAYLKCHHVQKIIVPLKGPFRTANVQGFDCSGCRFLFFQYFLFLFFLLCILAVLKTQNDGIKLLPRKRTLVVGSQANKKLERLGTAIKWRTERGFPAGLNKAHDANQVKRSHDWSMQIQNRLQARV